ncbi:MAG: hypothetical protein DI556_18720 [Rhodovulum sulfidophilum]|uniref:Uncharacterized protein n=1 Tax=Rhodovulum sulfidophilum TaxID=35806 RepID=A0A2W5N0N6_RHOSU|nr:MAG: hypothetical protein DI556_18720 [Rhodovulum sulfidophilum]
MASTSVSPPIAWTSRVSSAVLPSRSTSDLTSMSISMSLSTFTSTSTSKSRSTSTSMSRSL